MSRLKEIIIPYSLVLLEKLVIAEAVKKLCAF
jgi:hypothetical protein